MTAISSINANSANYNAVKIQVNDPKTIIPENFKKNNADNSIYNAINIEVNRPVVEVQKDPVYDYPENDSIVTYNMTGIGIIPTLPVKQPELKNDAEINTNIEDDDMMAAVLTASIDYQNEIKQDVRLVNVRRIK